MAHAHSISSLILTFSSSQRSSSSSSSSSTTQSPPQTSYITVGGGRFSRAHISRHDSELRSKKTTFATRVSGIWDAITGGGSNNNAREALFAIRRGMSLFRQGHVGGSMAEFDKAIELDPRQKAYLWQRGLSLYYLDRYEEGAEQFRIDVAENPNDTEESIWCFLCEAQLYGVHEARMRFLEVGRDSRPVMREAYTMFNDGGNPEKLVETFASGRENEYFYACLYAGLYYESQNKKSDEAKGHLIAACKSPYGLRSDDYMAALAKVHCKCRNWTIG